MAKQVLLEELQGCKTYLGYLIDKLNDCNDTPVSRELCIFLFETDFSWSIVDDSIRATDALELRKIYANEVGQLAGKSERDIDRIWKSVHGKTSVLELIFSLCRHLDAMVNEDESGSMIGFFYRILIHNLCLDEYGDEVFSGPYVVPVPDLKEAEKLSVKLEEARKLHAEVGTEESLRRRSEGMDKGVEESAEIGAKVSAEIGAKVGIEETLRRRSEVKEIWKSRVTKWLERDYFESGEEGGMFPLHEWKPGDKDQKNVSLWYQMNAWLNEHLDDEERFVA